MTNLLARLKTTVLLSTIFITAIYQADAASHPKAGFIGDTWISPSLNSPALYQDFKRDSISLVLSKGEFESFQLVLEIDSLSLLSIERSAASSLLRLNSYQLQPFEGVEDALVPIKQSLLANSNLVKLWFTYEADRQIKPGTYQEEISFSTPSATKTIKLSIEVKDISMPLTPSIPITFGIYQKALVKSDDPEVQLAKRKEYFELLFDHRISPYLVNWGPPNFRLEVQSSPYDWDDPRTEEYIRDPRFAAIALPYWGKTDEELKKLYARVEAANLLTKSYVYFIDEPHSLAAHDKVLEGVKRIRSIHPLVKVNLPFFSGLESSSNDIFEVFQRYEAFPMIFNTSNWALQNSETRSGQCASSINDGQEWWTYICCGQRPGFTHNTDAIGPRSLLWRSWKEGSTGFLYWAVNDYLAVDPLEMNKNLKPGDGTLIYPGSSFGVDQPVLSVRLERFRDGAEDYELLKMHEQQYGREATLALLQRVYQGPQHYCSDVKMVEEFRKALLNALAD